MLMPVLELTVGVNVQRPAITPLAGFRPHRGHKRWPVEPAVAIMPRIRKSSERRGALRSPSRRDDNSRELPTAARPKPVIATVAVTRSVSAARSRWLVAQRNAGSHEARPAPSAETHRERVAGSRGRQNVPPNY